MKVLVLGTSLPLLSMAPPNRKVCICAELEGLA